MSLTSAPRTVKRRAAPAASPARLALIEPIKKTRVAEEIADRIRVLILDGTFPPAQPLPAERLLAERFGVSRGSIRDALPHARDDRPARDAARAGHLPPRADVDRLVAPLASVLTYRHDLQDELLDVRRMFEPAVARARGHARRPTKTSPICSASSTLSAASSRPADRPSSRTRHFMPCSHAPRAIASSSASWRF